MQFTREQTGEMEILKLSGDLTIRHAAELKAVLVRALEQANYLIVELANVTETDVSCFQLLCSAHRTFLNSNKHMCLKIIDNDGFQQSAKLAGFVRNTGCALNPGAECLWIGRN